MEHLKLKKRGLKTDPAVILAGFGTTVASQGIYEKIGSMLQTEFKDTRFTWAYTSEIIREKKDIPGIYESIAQLEKEGFRKMIVQPLHLFPATEYRVLESVCNSFADLRVIMGETLGHRWPYIEKLFEIVSVDFLTADQGLNLVIAHGSPLAAEPANVIYQGLDLYCEKMWDNLLFATVDGLPTIEMMLRQLERNNLSATFPKARIFPFMVTSGKHVKEDLLVDDGCLKQKLEELGFEVDTPVHQSNGESIPKALGYYDDIISLLVERLRRSLDLLIYY
ncbi:MAG: sirohydrochlorin cobaltochelatase [Proteobacteria bacterium]|nr:sirohydrochlorin cobaltochelatase [Pseudomonadota bacterium]